MILIIFTLLFIIIFLRMILKHSKNPIKGGEMAISKRFWLFYTLYTWFIFLPICLSQSYISKEYIISCTLLTLSMWLRAPIELFMMYKTKNWTPPIGITHTSITLCLFIYSLFHIPTYKIDTELLFIISLALSLGLEIYYAIAFYKIVKNKTKGDEAIWFASKTDPRFKKILNVTHVGNIIVFTFLIMVFFDYLL